MSTTCVDDNGGFIVDGSMAGGEEDVGIDGSTGNGIWMRNGWLVWDDELVKVVNDWDQGKWVSSNLTCLETDMSVGDFSP